jgi:hypothetical protein
MSGEPPRLAHAPPCSTHRAATPGRQGAPHLPFGNQGPRLEAQKMVKVNQSESTIGISTTDILWTSSTPCTRVVDSVHGCVDLFQQICKWWGHPWTVWCTVRSRGPHPSCGVRLDPEVYRCGDRCLRIVSPCLIWEEETTLKGRATLPPLD